MSIGIVDAILGNTFLNKYGTYIKQKPEVKEVKVMKVAKDKVTTLLFTTLALLEDRGVGLVEIQKELKNIQFMFVLKETFVDKPKAPSVSGHVLPTSIKKVLDKHKDVLNNVLPTTLLQR